MALKQLFKTNLSKIIGLFILFLAIAFLGSILFTCGLGFRKRTLFLRMSYMIISVVWVVACIWGICVKVGFGKIWRGMIDDIYSSHENPQQKLAKQYQVLTNKYPIAIAEYESHRWKERPRPTNYDIMEDALNMSETEWEKKEIEAQNKMSEKHRKRVEKGKES